jgi:undecaprenyl-diphosphatase
MLEQELQWEKDWFFFLNGSESVFWDNFFWLYSNKWMGIPFYLCLLFVFVYKKNWKEILCLLLSVTLVILLCDQLTSGFFKPVFHRFRPTHHPDFQEQVDTVFGYRGGLYGFISSHAANAFGLATLTAFIFRNRFFTAVILFYAFLTGYSRIYLGVHFISDIVAGALAGVLLGYAVYQLYNLSRIYLLKTDRGDLKKPLYSKQSVYWICLVYVIYIVILLLFNNQLISLFDKH